MGQIATHRNLFVQSFNRAFGPDQIEQSLATLRPFLPGIDALEIVQRLGLLSWLPPGSFLRYRDVLGIPPVNMQVLTVAIHVALLGFAQPRPLSLTIVPGDVETVTLEHYPDRLALTLTRTRFEDELPGQN